MKDFILKLTFEIELVKNNNSTLHKSFAEFLHSLSHESLIEYYNLVQALNIGKKIDPKRLQKAITLYILILIKLEQQEVEIVDIDIDFKWTNTLACFMSAEMFLRDGLIDAFDGFLHEGNVNYKSNGQLEAFLTMHKFIE